MRPGEVVDKSNLKDALGTLLLVSLLVVGLQSWDQIETGTKRDWSVQSLAAHILPAKGEITVTWGVDYATSARDVFTSIAHAPQSRTMNMRWITNGTVVTGEPFEVSLHFAHAIIRNQGAAFHGRLVATFDGYAAPLQQMVAIEKDSAKELFLNPTFEARVKTLTASTPATFTLTLTDSASGTVVYSDSQRYQLLPLDYFAWQLADTDAAPYAAALITPNAPFVAQVLKDAAPRTPWGSIRGYKPVMGYSDTEVVEGQVGAVWDALQDRGFAYVSAPEAYATSAAQHIKSPAATYRDATGNCIESVLLLASVLEAIGMNVHIILVPGHAFLAVDAWKDNSTPLAIETTLLPSFTYSAARNQGAYTFNQSWETMRIIDIQAARQAGILPNPWLA